jgi:hypothetical protein
VADCFFRDNKWQWVRVEPRKVDAIRYVALYETVLDGENNNAPGGRGEVVGYAPVLGYEVATSGEEEGKYSFTLGEIQPLAIRAGDLYYIT